MIYKQTTRFSRNILQCNDDTITTKTVCCTSE